MQFDEVLSNTNLQMTINIENPTIFLLCVIAAIQYFEKVWGPHVN